jgi:hypothetical protein
MAAAVLEDQADAGEDAGALCEASVDLAHDLFEVR